MSEELKFMRTTIGLYGTHENLNVARFIRVELYGDEDSVVLVAIAGHTLKGIYGIPHVTITREAYSNSPDDPYDDSVEALWAMRILGIEVK